jgi:Holliday junction resolvasome RuvABC endonuclease subunit
MTMADTKDVKTVAGLDLSIASTGVVVIYPSFSADNIQNGDPMTGIFSETIRTKVDKFYSGQIERMIHISDRIIEILSRYCVNEVAIEGYAYSRAGAGKVFDLAELNGIVKYNIFKRFNMCPEVYAASSARKHLMGKCKRSNPKKQVASFLNSLGIYFKTHDAYDAFAIALKHFDKVNGNDPSLIKYWNGVYNNNSIFGME